MAPTRVAGALGDVDGVAKGSGGSQCFPSPVGACLLKHWRVWRDLGPDPRVVRVLRKGLYYKVPATLPSVLQAWILQASNGSCQVGSPGQRGPENDTKGGNQAGSSGSGVPPFPPVLGPQERRKRVIPTFVMETPESIRAQVRPRDWAVSIGLSDAYFHFLKGSGSS